MEKITISATINAPLEQVWRLYTDPHYVMQWNNASPDWHTPSAKNDLRVDGTFLYRMEARDGSFGFDFSGKYTAVKQHSLIVYTMDDGRTVSNTFVSRDGKIHVTVTFDPETQNSLDMQRDGWQAILDNFKRYAETTLKK